LNRACRSDRVDRSRHPNQLDRIGARTARTAPLFRTAPIACAIPIRWTVSVARTMPVA
jgi:hypothetical protein